MLLIFAGPIFMGCQEDEEPLINETPDNTEELTGTPGEPECIDETKIDPDEVCPHVYDPVCGCDGNDYTNACEAEKNGVLKWEHGAC